MRRIYYLLPLSFSFVLAVTSCSSDSTPTEPTLPPTEEGWQLVWQDEFEGVQGQRPHPDRWTYDIGTGDNGWGNAQLEYDTDRAENVSLDGEGNLVITAREESYQGQRYTSARILTRDLFERAYGRFEARIRLPSGAGLWPAFWLLGANIGDVGWPECGEIDIMEYLGQEPSVVHGSLHGPGYSAGNAITRKYTLPEARFDTDFHVFAIEWTENSIDWYVDDMLYHSITQSDIAPRTWVYDHRFFIILNLAVGGHFPGNPDASTVFPQSMFVDWVRVYSMGS